MKHWQETRDIVARLRVGGAGHGAVATVVRISGSAYRRPGAKLLVTDTNELFGGVSGGCLEADVREVGLDALRQGRACTRGYDTGADEDTVWGLGLGCEGQVELVVQPVTAATLPVWEAVGRLLDGDAPFAIVTATTGPGAGDSLVVVDGAVVAGTMGDASRDAALARRAADLVARGTSSLDPVGDGVVFTEVLLPPPWLTVCGAGDDAVPLVRLATDLGFRVAVVDHRPAFVAEGRFPAAQRRLTRRPEDGVAGLATGPDAAAVVMTHNLALDRAWVRAFAATPVGYIGVLGPRARTERIAPAVDQGSLFGPVGLDIGAEGPEQIAVSVLAELLAVRAGRAGGHLRDRGAGIHEDGPDGRVAGVVLAAGGSTRMGRNKLLLDAGGEPLVRRVTRQAIAAGLAPVLVVVGYEAARVREALAGLPCEFVENPDYASGINGSVQRGIARVPADAPAAVVILGDMPFVTAAMIRAVADRHRESGAPLVLSLYGDDAVHAPPTLYGRALFAEFGTDAGEGCGKRVVRRHRTEAAELRWPAARLADVDVPADYSKVADRLAGAAG